MSAREAIRTMVIDDSAFSRRTITRMLETSPLVEVVATACDGDDALRKAIELRPDLITLDLQMPRMDGFTFLRLLMAQHPTPVIVVSGRSRDGDVFKALDLGAVDFIAKPSARASEELAQIQDELIRKVHAVRALRVRTIEAAWQSPPPPASCVTENRAEQDEEPRVVAIGASTGGPAALMRLFESFDRAPAFATVVAQHMPAGFTKGFAERIDRRTAFRAKEAKDGDLVLPGEVLVAAGGSNLSLARSGSQLIAQLSHEDVPTHCKPSVDHLFRSVAKQCGAKALAVVLTGMGDDGKLGAREMKEAGARVLAESEETAVVFGMPKQAILSGAVDAVLPLWEIPAALRESEKRMQASGGGPS